MVEDPQMEQEYKNDTGPIMELSEHLDEMRSRMIRALVGVGIALVICLFYQDQLMFIITGPHRKAMSSLEKKIEEAEAAKKDEEKTPGEKFAAAIERIKSGDPDTAEAFELLAKELDTFKIDVKNRRGTLQAIKYQEAFISYIKIALVAAIVLSSPWIILQLWLFISAGLYKKEKMAVLIYIPFSLIAFAAGVVFGYYVLIPTGLTYLATYADPGLVSVQVTLGFYLSFFLLLTVALGFVFQLPLVMMFLARTGIVSAKVYSKNRKYAILVAAIVGAVLTPPDPVTQLLLASPVIFLYELGIVLSRIVGKKKKEETA